jgi:hypothetical protein
MDIGYERAQRCEHGHGHVIGAIADHCPKVIEHEDGCEAFDGDGYRDSDSDRNYTACSASECGYCGQGGY